MIDTPQRGRPARRTRDVPDPWTVPILVAQIPATGLHKIIAPTEQETKALAEVGGLLHATGIRAEFTLTPQRGDRIRVEGHVAGLVGQTCVVSLDPLDNPIDETIDLLFAPPDQISALAASADENEDEPGERPDPPEPIDDGVIDLGRIASDALFLGLDPYPRKADAILDLPTVEPDPDDHPFAALKALKQDE